jgi:hypothetical protein
LISVWEDDVGTSEPSLPLSMSEQQPSLQQLPSEQNVSKSNDEMFDQTKVSKKSKTIVNLF